MHTHDSNLRPSVREHFTDNHATIPRDTAVSTPNHPAPVDWAVNQRAILTTVQRPILTSLLRLSAGFLALFEAERIVAGFDDVAMVGDTVEQG